MTGMELGLGPAASSYVVADELGEVRVAVADRNVLHCIGGWFSRPGCLTGRPVSVKTCAGCCHPVVETLAGIREVAMPAERGRAVLVGVVGAEPMQVQCRELPDQLGVSVPERWHDGRWEPIRPS